MSLIAALLAVEMDGGVPRVVGRRLVARLLVSALGCGIGTDLDATLIESGAVHIAQPPLYTIEIGRETW